MKNDAHFVIFAMSYDLVRVQIHPLIGQKYLFRIHLTKIPRSSKASGDFPFVYERENKGLSNTFLTLFWKTLF